MPLALASCPSSAQPIENGVGDFTEINFLVSYFAHCTANGQKLDVLVNESDQSRNSPIRAATGRLRSGRGSDVNN